MCLFAVCVSFFGIISIQIFWLINRPFLLGSLSFYLLFCKSSEFKSFIKYVFYKYFLPVSALLVHFLNSIFFKIRRFKL